MGSITFLSLLAYQASSICSNESKFAVSCLTSASCLGPGGHVLSSSSSSGNKLSDPSGNKGQLLSPKLAQYLLWHKIMMYYECILLLVVHVRTYRYDIGMHYEYIYARNKYNTSSMHGILYGYTRLARSMHSTTIL